MRALTDVIVYLRRLTLFVILPNDVILPANGWQALELVRIHLNDIELEIQFTGSLLKMCVIIPRLHQAKLM